MTYIAERVERIEISPGSSPQRARELRAKAVISSL